MLQGLVAGLLWWVLPAQAQGIELAQLQTARQDGELTLEFAARITLPKAVEEALHRGVPVYFVAEATLRRYRWYWRDERVARVSRSWRIAFQPLTSSWRVGLGALNQTYPTLPDAIAAVSRSAGWKIADLSQLDPDARYTLEFSFRLDTSQLPGPMQIGLGGQGEWAIGADRSVRVE
jgi:hypothetical protein